MPYNVDIIGWMQVSDLEVLSKLAESVPEFGTIIEIGSLFGRSSVCIAMSAKNSVKIQCIDRFPEHCIMNHDHPDDFAKQWNWPLHGVRYNSREEFKKNTKEFSNIEMWVGNSPNQIIDYQIPSSIDMLFVDSDHTNPGDWNNLAAFIPSIRVGGIISGHDYNQIFPDVIQNVHRLEQLFDTKVILTPGSSVWWMIKTKEIEL